jgi:hypothetical protein
MSQVPLYLAGASRELDRVLPMVAKLEESGLVRFTYEWWKAVQRHGVGKDHELTNDDRRSYALRDASAIADSRIFWLLYPDGVSFGAAFELGYAMRCRATTIVTGKCSRNSPFPSIASFEHEVDEAGLAHVLELAWHFGARKGA